MVSYSVPARFSPYYSLLGRLIQRLVPDRLKAESVYLVGSSTLVLIVILLAYLYAGISMDASMPAPVASFGMAAVIIATAGIGVKPSIRLRWNQQILRIDHASSSLSIESSDIQNVRVMDSTTYYRSLHKFGSVTEYVNRYYARVMIIETPSQIVAIALPEEGLQQLAESMKSELIRLRAKSVGA